MNKKLSFLLLLSVAVPVYSDESLPQTSFAELTTSGASTNKDAAVVKPERPIISENALQQLIATTPQPSSKEAAELCKARDQQLQDAAWHVVRTALKNGNLESAFSGCRETLAESEREALVKYVKDDLYALLAAHARPDLTKDEEAIRALLTDFGQEINKRGVSLIQLDGHNVVSRYVAKHPYGAGGICAVTFGIVYAIGRLTAKTVEKAVEQVQAAA